MVGVCYLFESIVTAKEKACWIRQRHLEDILGELGIELKAESNAVV